MLLTASAEAAREGLMAARAAPDGEFTSRSQWWRVRSGMARRAVCLAAVWLAVVPPSRAQDIACPVAAASAHLSWERFEHRAAAPGAGSTGCVHISETICTDVDRSCCTEPAQCLETAQILCSQNWQCRAVGYNAAEGYARLLRENYGPMQSGCTDCSDWDMYVKRIRGCMDTTAVNYNFIATVSDDDACEFTYGCLESTNANYDPMAMRHNQSDCAPEPEPEPEPEPVPEPEPDPEPEPWACPEARHDELTSRLLRLASSRSCFGEMFETHETATACSDGCRNAVEADGVFHVCDATKEHAACLEAANRHQSFLLAGRVWRWQEQCFGPAFDPCSLEQPETPAVVDPARTIAEEQANAARAMEGSAVLVTMTLSPRPGTSEVSELLDAPYGWPPLRNALLKILRVAETSVLLHPGWSITSTSLQLQFVLTDDPASDRSARHVYTELLKRVRMSLALGEDTAGDGDEESSPLPLPAWMPMDIHATHGAGECVDYDASGSTIAAGCTSGMAIALQWLALFYQVGVAIVVAAAVSIHAAQHMTKWM